MIRARSIFENKGTGKKHLIFSIANHFEPAWKEKGFHDIDTQHRRLDDWCDMARRIGEAVIDADGTKFRHSNFYPAELYDKEILNKLADLQKEGLGEVEVHLHHGVDKPDTTVNLRRQLLEFRDRLAEDHKCLSKIDGEGSPKYAFVHGNWTLGNSAEGKCCGVDDEFAVLSETGCYMDMTLPSAPHESQVPMLNAIYECSLPFDQQAPHRKGRRLAVGDKMPNLPVMVTGPLMFNWQNRKRGIPFPKIETGELAHFSPTDIDRVKRWIRAGVAVKGQPDWMFIKLHCHGFFDQDQSACIGEGAKKFFSEIVEYGNKSGEYDVHFTSARETFNMIVAAMDGKKGSPGKYRDYYLSSIMRTNDKFVQGLTILLGLFSKWSGLSYFAEHFAVVA